MAHVPDLNDFVGGIAIVLAPRRRGDDRGPAPAAPGRGQPVRHDLPRALLVLLAADRAQGARRPRAGALRRRGAASRTAARCASMPSARRPAATPVSATASTELAARERALGFDTLEGAPLRSPRRSQETKWQPARVPDRARREGKRDRRLRRAGQGQHAAELLRHPHRPARVHGRPQPLQAGPVPARDAHPDQAPARRSSRTARLHPDPALEPQAARSSRSSRTRASGARSSSSRSRRSQVL